MSTQNFDRTYFAGAQFDRSGSTALQQGVRAILFAALTTTAGVAGAQVVEGQQVEGQQIEEIVVTAARREQSFQDVPMAVSALNAQRLRDTGVVEFAQIASQVPSLEVEGNTNPFTTSLRIRGLGNLANIPNFEPAVGLFIDNAYRSRSGVAMGDLLDVERIEVLRGPQSVLYPKNVTAGLINVITNGLLLSPEVVGRLVPFGLNGVKVTLDGDREAPRQAPDPATHSGRRKCPWPDCRPGTSSVRSSC